MTNTAMTQNTRSTRKTSRALTAVAMVLAVALTAGTADARAGKSSSSGSRGARTHEAPAATNTAPTTAAPMERSAAPTPGPNAQRPGMANPAPAQSGGFFSRGGFMPALVGGLIGAGIGGLLFGSGFFDGLGSFAGILGFILQILLVVFLVRFAVKFFRNRSAQQGRPMGGMGGMGAPGTAYAGGPNPGPAPGGPLNRDAMDVRYNPLGGAGAGAGAAPAGAARPGVGRDDVGIGPADYEAFEQTLVGVQTAYGREDLAALNSLVTPEMQSYFSEELADNNRRGVVNKLSDVRLLQGDLAEAWREGNVEYATVAMRFSLIDATVDRATNRVVEGDLNSPSWCL